MSTKPWNCNFRAPRHNAAEASLIEVAVVRHSSEPEQCMNAELINLSRQGMQIRIGKTLAKGEVVETRFWRREAESCFQQQATVLWARPDENQWLVGCQFETEVEWESMGELFANNVLEM